MERCCQPCDEPARSLNRSVGRHPGLFPRGQKLIDVIDRQVQELCRARPRRGNDVVLRDAGRGSSKKQGAAVSCISKRPETVASCLAGRQARSALAWGARSGSPPRVLAACAATFRRIDSRSPGCLHAPWAPLLVPGPDAKEPMIDPTYARGATAVGAAPAGKAAPSAALPSQPPPGPRTIEPLPPQALPRDEPPRGSPTAPSPPPSRGPLSPSLVGEDRCRSTVCWVGVVQDPAPRGAEAHASQRFARAHPGVRFAHVHEHVAQRTGELAAQNLFREVVPSTDERRLDEITLAAAIHRALADLEDNDAQGASSTANVWRHLGDVPALTLSSVS